MKSYDEHGTTRVTRTTLGTFLEVGVLPGDASSPPPTPLLLFPLLSAPLLPVHFLFGITLVAQAGLELVVGPPASASCMLG